MRELAELVDRGDGLALDASCTSRCRSTTRRSADPTSRWPASGSGGSRTVDLREGLTRTADWLRTVL